MTVYLNEGMWAGTLQFKPELRTTQAGKGVCRASLMVIRSYIDKDGAAQERKLVVRLLAWGRAAEPLSGFDKGDNVLVKGSLDSDKRQDDTWETVVNVFSVQLLGEPAQAEQPRRTASSRTTPPAATSDSERSGYPDNPPF